MCYSSTGFSAEIAKEISRAAEKAGAEVRLLKAAELAPEAAIASNEAWAAHAAARGRPGGLPRRRRVSGRGDLRTPTRSAARHQAERVVQVASALKAGLAAT